MKLSFLAPFAGLLSIFLACNSQNPSTSEPASATKTKAMGCESLDGRSYTITLTAGGKSEAPEVLSFKDKTVESSECLQYGFTASPYTCNAALDGTLAVETVMNSEKEGRMDWKFSVTDTQVRGTVLWVKAGQADIAYTFEGSAK